MSVKIENKTNRLVILRLNSGDTPFIDPGTFPGEIGDEEISNNTMVKKLVDRGVIAVHSQPAVKNRTLEQSPASAPLAGVEKPEQEKNDKKQQKSKTKGGK